MAVGYERPGGIAGSSAGYRPAPQRGGPRRDRPTTPRERRWMAQLVVSGVILVLAVLLKLTAPQAMATVSDRLSSLMGTDTDFVAAFSDVGKAVSGGKVGEALNDAYVAVFGPSDGSKSTDGAAEKTAAATDGTAGTGAASVPVVYSADNLPARVCLEQQVLGFSYQAPVEGVLTSEFGLRAAPASGQEKFHYGVDLGVDDGTVIHCFADGTVTVVGDSSELGKYVMVQHTNGFVSLYGHCSKITASSGQTVREGDPIAEAGHTGNATGPHLHFELHHDAVYLNPVYYV